MLTPQHAAFFSSHLTLLGLDWRAGEQAGPERWKAFLAVLETKYPNPKSHEAWRGAGKQGKGAAGLASEEIAWKDKTAGLGLSFFCPEPPKGGRLLAKADPRFLLQSPLGACARPPRQVAPQDQAVIIGPGWTSRSKR